MHAQCSCARTPLVPISWCLAGLVDWIDPQRVRFIVMNYKQGDIILQYSDEFYVYKTKQDELWGR